MTERYPSTVFVVIPVFNRLEETLSCINDLRRQRYPNVEIVVVDGGSTDGTVAELQKVSDVHLIWGVGEQWWTGATWLGIDHALARAGDDDFVMLLNNDTAFGPEMLDVLVEESLRLDAAVAPIARAADGSVVNAGTWIDWSTYVIEQRMSEPDVAESTWSVGVLEGRGSLVPVRAIRAAGNVERVRLPHHAADYEFSLRIARHGCALMMTNRTSITVDWDVPVLMRYHDRASVRRIWWELTNRRSFVSIPVHFSLIDLACPDRGRWKLKVRFLRRTAVQMAPRTQAWQLPVRVRTSIRRRYSLHQTGSR